MESPEVIEVNEEPPSFNEDEWIGKGRRYPKGDDAPLALRYYIDSLLTIPDTVKDKYTPSRNLSIKDFTKMELPKISHNLPMIKAEICALKHALEVTPFGLKISLEDWGLFKVILDESKTVLNALKALAGKKKVLEDNGED
jgi:hypothetical protein